MIRALPAFGGLVYIIFCLALLRSCFMKGWAELREAGAEVQLSLRERDPSSPWGRWMLLRSQWEIVPAAREEPHSEVPLTEAVPMWSIPCLCCPVQGTGVSVVGWQPLSSLKIFLFSSSIVLLTGSRERRSCLLVSFLT